MCLAAALTSWSDFWLHWTRHQYLVAEGDLYFLAINHPLMWRGTCWVDGVIPEWLIERDFSIRPIHMNGVMQHTVSILAAGALWYLVAKIAVSIAEYGRPFRIAWLPGRVAIDLAMLAIAASWA